MTRWPTKPALDPVTFEVLKNSFITSVDQMAEQILRTCYSFVIYNRDFSSALHDAEGNSAAQGNQDIAVHVGTLHFTCKDVMRAFDGDMHPGDVYAINDPYAGGTHFSDVRLIRPIFADGKIIAFSQSNGHWSDVGGSVPGSFDVVAREMFREGLRITPVRLFDKGRFCRDVAHLIASNTRDPVSIIGDIAGAGRGDAGLRARNPASGRTNTAARRSRPALRPCRTMSSAPCASASPRCPTASGKRRTSSTATPSARGTDPDQGQADHQGRPGDLRLHRQPSDHRLDLQLRIRRDVLRGRGRHEDVLPRPAAQLAASTAPFEIIAPEGSIVDAQWPIAVTGFLMPFEKIMNAIYEIWSKIMPERAIACAFNLEYLLTGGLRRTPAGEADLHVLRLAARRLGRSQRQGRLQRHHCLLRHRADVAAGRRPGAGEPDPDRPNIEILTDSPGPGKWRGGAGVRKTSVMLAAENTVISYICDRERAVVWGIEGGLPSMPHGLTLKRAGTDTEEWLGSIFSDVPIGTGDVFSRPTAGGGGFGDPLERDPELVLEDVADDYVSIERAREGLWRRDQGDRRGTLRIRDRRGGDPRGA